MWIRAKAVLPMSGPKLCGGAVRVEDGRITAVGEAEDGGEVVDLGDAVLMPGMINAHCHLDYTGFKGAIFRGKGFTEWIKQINSLKQSFTPEDYLEFIRQGIRLSMEAGITTVFNIAAFPELLARLERPPLRIWWFLELIDIRTRISRDETLIGALSFFDEHSDWLGGFGLSPHAPYTASVELYRLAKHCGEAHGMPFTTHIAESVEEQEMFLHGAGPLYDFTRSLGRNMGDCGQGSAFSHLMEHGVLGEHGIAVHLNYMQLYDWAAVKEQPLHVVHCPKCHAYFGHARFPLERFRAAGANVCLGTDSMASNETLDMRAEVRIARRNYPEVTAVEWLEMITRNPARAIGQAGMLGELAPGARADLVAFPLADGEDPAEAVIRSECPPLFLMVDGVRLDV